MADYTLDDDDKRAIREALNIKSNSIPNRGNPNTIQNERSGIAKYADKFNSALLGAVNAPAEGVLGAAQLIAAGIQPIGNALGVDFVGNTDRVANNYKDAYNDLIKGNEGSALAGNIAGSLVGAGASRAIPAVRKGVDLVTRLPTLGKIAAGAIAGEAQNIARPVYGEKSNTFDARTKNFGQGAVVGAALPAGLAGLGAIDNRTSKLFSDSRAADYLLGNTEFNRSELADALNSFTKKNAVKGVTTTTPEALRDLGVSNNKILKTFRDTKQKDFSGKIVDTLQANNKARVDALREVQGTPQERLALESIRESNAKENYGALKPVEINDEIKYALNLNGVRPNLLKAQESLDASKPFNIEKIISGRPNQLYLHPEATRQITTRLNQAASPSNLANTIRDDADILRQTGNRFNEAIEKVDPSYAAARQKYARDSAPINDSNLASELENTAQRASANEGYNQLDYVPYNNKLSELLDNRVTAYPPSPNATSKFNNINNSLEGQNYLDAEDSAGILGSNHKAEPVTLRGLASKILFDPPTPNIQSLADLLSNSSKFGEQLNSNNYKLYNAQKNIQPLVVNPIADLIKYLWSDKETFKQQGE